MQTIVNLVSADSDWRSCRARSRRCNARRDLPNLAGVAAGEGAPVRNLAAVASRRRAGGAALRGTRARLAARRGAARATAVSFALIRSWCPCMLAYPHFNPIALQIGPLAVHWYGLTYLAAFGCSSGWARAVCSCPSSPPAAGPAGTWKTCSSTACWASCSAVDWVTCCSTSRATTAATAGDLRGVEGGMSFHGECWGAGGGGVVRVHARRQFLDATDLVALACPPDWRRAHRQFINGELPGRLADPSLPWSMVYPNAVPCAAPLGLYQFALEVCCCSSCCGSTRNRAVVWGRSPARSCGYGVLRFTAEFFASRRLLGLLALNLSMGQWLCVPMILAGSHSCVGRAGRRAEATAPSRDPIPGECLESADATDLLDTETTGLSPEAAIESSKSLRGDGPPPAHRA